MTPAVSLNLGPPPPDRAGRANLRPSFAAQPRYDRVVQMRRRRVVDIRARYAVRGLRGVAVLAGASAVGVAYLFSPMAAAALFSVLFVAFAYAMPLAALSLILALSPIQNDLGGADSPVKFAPAELLMFLALPAALLKMGLRPRIGPTFLPTLFYLGVCAVASVDSIRPTTIVSMFQMALYMIIAVIVFSNLEHRPGRLARVFDLYILAASLLSVIGLYTNFTFLGTHKNGWGASLSTALIVAVDQWFQARTGTRRRLMSLALIAIGSALVMTVSRGGWMAAVLGIAIVCAVRRQFGGLLKIGLLLIPVACVAWYFLPQQLRDYAFGFEAGRDNIRLRYESVDKAMMWWQRDPVIGVGVGLRKEYDATNIILLTLAESGWAGLVTFLGVHLAVVAMMRRIVARVRPDGVMFSFAVLSVALLGARLAHGLVDHYWSRGPITCAWAAVGLATLSYQAMRHEAAKRQQSGVRILSARPHRRPASRSDAQFKRFDERRLERARRVAYSSDQLESVRRTKPIEDEERSLAIDHNGNLIADASKDAPQVVADAASGEPFSPPASETLPPPADADATPNHPNVVAEPDATTIIVKPAAGVLPEADWAESWESADASANSEAGDLNRVDVQWQQVVGIAMHEAHAFTSSQSDDWASGIDHTFPSAATFVVPASSEMLPTPTMMVMLQRRFRPDEQFERDSRGLQRSSTHDDRLEGEALP